MKVEIKILDKELYKAGFKSTGNEDLIEYHHNLPSYATPGSAAVDLRSTQDIIMYPGDQFNISTGLAIWIGSTITPLYDVAGLIMSRSGLGTRGLVLANTVGVIDEDYQGELVIPAYYRQTNSNTKDNTYIEIKKGDRIAQMLLVPVIKAEWAIVEEFSGTTRRNTNGFGSSGV